MSSLLVVALWWVPLQEGEAPVEAAPPPAEDQGELLPPDEELAPDDLEFSDPPEGAPEPGSAGSPPGESPAGAASESPEELFELDEELHEPPPLPDPVVVHEEGATASQMSTAATIALAGCAAFTLVGVGIGLLANPLVATFLVLNAFAPAVVVPLGCGSLVTSQTMLSGVGFACCVGGPAPAVLATGAGVAGASAQLVVNKPWLPLGAAAAGAVPGVLLGVGALVGVAAGVVIGTSAPQLDLERIASGGQEPLYLTPPLAITGGIVALVAALVGAFAAPVAGGGAALAGFLTATGWSGPGPEDAPSASVPSPGAGTAHLPERPDGADGEVAF